MKLYSILFFFWKLLSALNCPWTKVVYPATFHHSWQFKLMLSKLLSSTNWVGWIYIRIYHYECLIHDANFYCYWDVHGHGHILWTVHVSFPKLEISVYAIGHFYIKFMFPTMVIYRSVLGFVTECPCYDWCSDLTIASCTLVHFLQT